MEYQSCRRTSLSEVLSASESIKERHSAGYLHSSVYVFHLPVISALSGI